MFGGGGGGGGGLANAGKFLGKAGAIGAIGYGLYQAGSGYSAANKDLEAGKISEKEASARKGQAVGGAVGGAGLGIAGGALAGAAMGSVVPVIGTAIGGIIGGALGYYFGNKAGSAVGGALAGGGDDDTKNTAKTTAEDKPQTTSDNKFADIFGKHVEKFGDIVNKLGNTNRVMSSPNDTSFGKNVESFGKIVIAFAKTVTAFVKITQTFATITGTFSKAVTMFAAQNKSVNAIGTNKVRGKSSGLLGTPTGEDSELDVVEYIKNLKTALSDTTLSTNNLREAEMKRHRFTEESMMQFRRSLTDASKVLDRIAGVKRKDEDDSTDRGSGGDGGGGAGGGGGGEGAGSSDNAKKAMEYFMKQGWTKEQSAGIVGNLQQESGKNLDPGAENSIGMYGIAQWDKTRRKQFEKAMGKSIYGSSLEDQLAFIQHELTEGKDGGAKKAGRKLKSADTANEAASAFERYYERSGGSSLGKRIANAESLMSDDRAEDAPLDIKGNSLGTGSKDIVPLGRQLESQGIRVAEHPAFGGVQPVHKGRGHYEGRAIDINVGRGVNESKDPKARARFDQIADSARSAGFKVIWKAPGHYSHMHIESPKKSSLQARKGGLVKGPESGYPVEMHGSEMITPLTQDSILAKLAKTPAETPEISNAISSTAPTMEKEILERVVSMNSELVEGMLSKLGDMVSAISDGNDTREKILKNSMV